MSEIKPITGKKRDDAGLEVFPYTDLDEIEVGVNYPDEEYGDSYAGATLNRQQATALRDHLNEFLTTTVCGVCKQPYEGDGIRCRPDPKHPGYSYCVNNGDAL